jgi:hypothetical protein
MFSVLTVAFCEDHVGLRPDAPEQFPHTSEQLRPSDESGNQCAGDRQQKTSGVPRRVAALHRRLAGCRRQRRAACRRDRSAGATAASSSTYGDGGRRLCAATRDGGVTRRRQGAAENEEKHGEQTKLHSLTEELHRNV